MPFYYYYYYHYNYEIFDAVTPKIRISPSQVSARLGQSLSLTCQPEGSGPFQIEWQKVGGVLSPAARERDGVLEIRQLTAADAGQYKCIATSSVGTSEGYATITVLGNMLQCLEKPFYFSIFNTLE